MGRLAPLLCALLAFGACGGAEPETNGAAEPDTTATDTTVTGEPELTFRPVWAHAGRADFPHGPHQRLECSSCHVRVPDHGAHTDVACRDCHPVPAEVARTVVPDETECLTCHHVRRRALPCRQCHQAGEVAGPRTVATPMRVAAWPDPRSRDFTFDHTWHDSLGCRDCHAASVTNAPETACRSCHEEHHRPEATCARCHVPAEEGVHGDAVHQGCGGAGCHTNPVVLQLPPSRTLCLSCHAAQQDHEPDGDCATCHGIRDAWPRGGRR